MSNTPALAWRWFRRELAAGEVRILLAALVLAVAAVTTIGFVTARAQRALTLEANRLLGGDALVRGDAPFSAALLARAAEPGLAKAQTLSFPSMLRASSGMKLAEVRALGPGFPLRGSFRIARGADAADAAVPGGPARGTVWVGRSGAASLGIAPGDSVRLGAAELRVAALVTHEPDSALDFFAIAPRVFLHLDDLPATQLVQPGSRIGYRLVVAGEAAAVASFVADARAQLGRGQRLETVAEGRPEIRNAIARAERFLGLAAFVAVVLGAVAVAMAARRHGVRHVDACATLRCLGASQRTIAGILLGELLLLGTLGSALGIALAYALQAALGAWLERVLGVPVPHADAWPLLEGAVVGYAVLAGFAAPPLLALRRVAPLRAIRRELSAPEPRAWLALGIAIATLAALAAWKAGSLVLAATLLGGLAATAGALALLGWLLIRALDRLRPRLRGPWRYGLANLARRGGTSLAQVAALGLGLMVLLLLTLVRTSLLERWRDALPADAPNRFLVNVQREQAADVTAVLRAAGIESPALVPIVRARLVAVNDAPVRSESFEDERSRRLAEREFNLSWAGAMRDDNRLVAGRFWEANPADTRQLSVEEGFARSLGWQLGDRIRFDIAGSPFEARITSLRAVEWQSFRPNFFVLAAPGALDDHAASFITAFHVSPAQAPALDALIERHPNLSVVDVDAVLSQVRRVGDQVALAIGYVFQFTLAAGLLVLLAAVGASQDERLLEGAVLRVLGASRRQLLLAQLSEFAALGLVTGVVAALGAGVISAIVAQQVFDLPWSIDFRLAAAGALAGVVGIGVAGLIATRRVVNAPPRDTLRALGS